MSYSEYYTYDTETLKRETRQGISEHIDMMADYISSLVDLLQEEDIRVSVRNGWWCLKDTASEAEFFIRYEPGDIMNNNVQHILQGYLQSLDLEILLNKNSKETNYGHA